MNITVRLPSPSAHQADPPFLVARPRGIPPTQLDDLSPVFEWYADGEGWYIDHEADSAKASHFKETYHETPTEVSLSQTDPRRHFSSAGRHDAAVVPRRDGCVRLWDKGHLLRKLHWCVAKSRGRFFLLRADGTVSLNGETPQSFLGYLDHPAYQSVLYSQENLDPCTEYTVVRTTYLIHRVGREDDLTGGREQAESDGEHHHREQDEMVAGYRLRRADGGTVSLPFCVLGVDLVRTYGSDNRVEYTTLIDDTCGLITYTGGGWRSNQLPRLELYQNHTVHNTATQGDAYSIK